MWETIIGVVIGAVASFFPAWYFNNRSHKWELEEKKRERAIAAREIRLEEGEEKIKVITSELYYVMKITQKMINAKVRFELQSITKLVTGYEKTGEEMDKGNVFNEVSVNSLVDEKLTKSMENVNNSYAAYKSFYIYLVEFLNTTGFTSLQKEHDKNAEKELALSQSYFSSVEEFLTRINEIRSQ